MNVTQLPVFSAGRASAPAPPPTRGGHGPSGSGPSFDAMVAAYSETAGDEDAGGAPARTGAGTLAATEAGGTPQVADESPIDPAQSVSASVVPPFVQPAEQAGWATAFALAVEGELEGEASHDDETQATATAAHDDDPTVDLTRWGVSSIQALDLPTQARAQVPAGTPGSNGDAAATHQPEMPKGRPFTGTVPGLATAVASASAKGVAQSRVLNDVAEPADASRAPVGEFAAEVQVAATDVAASAGDVARDGAGDIARDGDGDGDDDANAAQSKAQIQDPTALTAALRRAASSQSSAPASENATPGARSAPPERLVSQRTDAPAGPKGATHAPLVSSSITHAMPLTVGVARAAEVVSSNSVFGGDTLPDGTINDIVQSIRLRAIQGGGEATIRLDPQHFGEVKVSLRVDDGQVVARVTAESSAVRDWLQNNQGWLRNQLAEQQLTLDRLDIREPAESQEPGRGEAEQRSRDDQRRQRRTRQDETGMRFDVVA